jgi:RNA polymerase Rpb8
METRTGYQINSDIYPMNINETFSLALASSLAPEGDEHDSSSREAWRPGRGGIADDYEYVCYGKVRETQTPAWVPWLTWRTRFPSIL